MINLTIPLFPHISTGNVFPWESPFVTEDIATYEKNAARLFYISLGSTTGTRLLAPSLVIPDATTISKVPLEKLLNRNATILNIPKKANEVIFASDIEFAFNNAHPQLSDAIIIVTGWGDNQRWKNIGENYIVQSPSISQEAALLLLAKMDMLETDLLLTDCSYLDSLSNNPILQSWLDYPAWMRIPWPSDISKAFLRMYSNNEFNETWKVTSKLLSKLWIVVGLANCRELKITRTRISCTPMFIESVGEAPCTVVAEEFEVNN